MHWVFDTYVEGDFWYGESARNWLWKDCGILKQAILRLYDEWLGSSFICDENLILRLPDDECIESEWFVKAEELA